MPKQNAIVELMRVPEREHDLEWLKAALQAAIELEFATLPPYLAARWSIKNRSDPVARSIREITTDEMLHMGQACNLLVAIGGSPAINTADAVPVYPGPLPGGVNPELIVSLQGLTPESVQLFMEIEYPASGPVEFVDTIGEFYAAIQTAFDTLQPTLSGDCQLSLFGLRVVETLSQVTQAIEKIRVQGEGSATSPDEPSGDLAHYYRFGEVYHGRRFVFDDVADTWGYNGDEVEFPEVWPMAVVPEGGYTEDQVSTDVWTLLMQFDQTYTEMITQLHTAWADGSDDSLRDARNTMFGLQTPAVSLMEIPIPNTNFTYGPCFRLV